MTSRRVLNKLAKIHLANMLNCIKIENDDASSIEEVKSSKIVDDATFDIFEEEFKKEKIKIINFCSILVKIFYDVILSKFIYNSFLQTCIILFFSIFICKISRGF